ncbi:hypothetical protein ACIGO8_33050 [Streptomyces sp. NPDC053493]|uniref:hypothetical protein n=1 Tax=Streptomyces sp. NPDC053493 TaxID=3365705 RepID=UPI0037D33332
MADEPRPTEPPSELPNEARAERKPLLQRAAGAWKRRSPAWKAGAIGVVAAAAAGAVAYARRVNAANDDAEHETEREDEPPKPTGILADVARILEEAAAAALDELDAGQEEEPEAADGASGPYRPRRGGPVSGHWRDHCLNPRGHASGNCTHKKIFIPDYVKGGKEEETAEA